MDASEGTATLEAEAWKQGGHGRPARKALKGLLQAKRLTETVLGELCTQYGPRSRTDIVCTGTRTMFYTSIIVTTVVADSGAASTAS